MNQSTVFALLPSEILMDVITATDAPDIRAFSACNKELNHRISLLEMIGMQDVWFKRRTDAQLQKTLLSVVDNGRCDILEKLLQPCLRHRIGDSHLAIAFIHTVCLHFKMATMLLPFCKCSLKKSSETVLKRSLESPLQLVLTSYRVHVYGQPHTFVNFNARMCSVHTAPDGLTRNIACMQWPLRLDNEGHIVTFWMGAPPHNDEWSTISVDLSLEHRVLKVHCSGIPP